MILACTTALAGCGGSGGGGSGTAYGSADLPGSFCPARDTEQIFIEVASGQQSDIDDREFASQTLRRSLVKVDVEALTGVLESGTGVTARLALFPDRPLEVVFDSIQRVSEKSFVATGKVIDDPESAVSLVVNDGVVVANFRSPKTQEKYELRPAEGGLYSMRAEGADHDSGCATVAAPPALPSEAALSEAADEGPMAAPVVDMLVAYTPAARQHSGGKAAIEALIRMGVADTARAMADSGVNLSVRLVGMIETQQNETSNHISDLTALKTNGDGRWDEVHAERKRVGADQVTLVAAYLSNLSAAGVGYTNASATSAFTIMRDTYFGQYTMAHELGHNLGLNHEDGLESSTGRFRTIIAYGSQPRIRRYSNPALPYNGYATGDGAHNEAKILNANALRGSSLVAAVLPQLPNDGAGGSVPACEQP